MQTWVSMVATLGLPSDAMASLRPTSSVCTTYAKGTMAATQRETTITEGKAAEKRAKEEARASAEAAAVAEANAVLERQAARPDATAAILTSVLLKWGGTASPEVVARTRAKRDSLKAAARCGHASRPRRSLKRAPRPNAFGPTGT